MPHRENPQAPGFTALRNVGLQATTLEQTPQKIVQLPLLSSTQVEQESLAEEFRAWGALTA